MFAIKNLIDKNDINTPLRLNRLRELGLVDKLEMYLNMSRESRSSDSNFSTCSVRGLIRRLVGYNSSDSMQ